MSIYFFVTLVLCALAQLAAKKSFRSIPVVREVMNGNLLMVKHSPSKPKTIKFSVYQVWIMFINFWLVISSSEYHKVCPVEI